MKPAPLHLLLVVLFSTIAPLRAALVINMVESGGDVVATLSGSINSWSGATTRTGTAGMFNGIRNSAPPLGVFSISSIGGTSSTFRDINYYSVPVYPSSFGVGTTLYFATPTSVSTYMQFRASGVDTLVVDQTYVLGTPVTGTLTWTNTSFADLDVTEGSYLWSWTGDSVTLNIGGSAPIPEPGTWAAAALLAGGAAFARWRKRAKVS